MDRPALRLALTRALGAHGAGPITAEQVAYVRLAEPRRRAALRRRTVTGSARRCPRRQRRQVIEEQAKEQAEASRGLQIEYGTPVSLEPPGEGPGSIESDEGTPIPLPAGADAPALPAGE